MIRDLPPGPTKPGVTLRLLEPLVALPTEDQPRDTEQLLSAADERYGDDPWHAERLLELRIVRKAGDEEEVLNLRGKVVDTWRQAAAQATG